MRGGRAAREGGGRVVERERRPAGREPAEPSRAERRAQLALRLLDGRGLVGRPCEAEAAAVRAALDDGAYVAYATPTPWYLGSTTTDRVARAAVHALRGDRADVIVNGRPVRPLALLECGAPRLAQAVLDRLGLPSFTGTLAAKQLPYSS